MSRELSSVEGVQPFQPELLELLRLKASGGRWLLPNSGWRIQASGFASHPWSYSHELEGRGYGDAENLSLLLELIALDNARGIGDTLTV